MLTWIKLKIVQRDCQYKISELAVNENQVQAETKMPKN